MDPVLSGEDDPDRLRRSPLRKAFVASFAIYLLPLVSAHGMWLLGEFLLMPVPDRVVGWRAMNIGLAIAMQLAIGTLCYWFFRLPKWRRLLPALGILVCVPALWRLGEWAYLYAIPSHYFNAEDPAPETGNWQTACAIADLALAPVRTTLDSPLERAGEAWLSNADGRSHVLLEMPGCRTTSVEFQIPDVDRSHSQLRFALPGGRCVLRTWGGTAGNRWWFHDGTTRPLPRPPSEDRNVHLSADAQWVAWQESASGETPERVVIRALHDDRERIVAMPSPTCCEHVLLGLDMGSGELTFFEFDYETGRRSLVFFDLDGKRTGQPLVAEGVEPQSTTFLRVGRGWVAWDAVRYSEPYRLAWSLPAGRGALRLPKLITFTEVAVDPAGTHIAIHTNKSLFVLRASDGVEVWRRHLPVGSSGVTFLGDDLLAFSDWNGAHLTTRVLQMGD